MGFSPTSTMLGLVECQLVGRWLGWLVPRTERPWLFVTSLYGLQCMHGQLVRLYVKILQDSIARQTFTTGHFFAGTFLAVLVFF